MGVHAECFKGRNLCSLTNFKLLTLIIVRAQFAYVIVLAANVSPCIILLTLDILSYSSHYSYHYIYDEPIYRTKAYFSKIVYTIRGNYTHWLPWERDNSQIIQLYADVIICICSKLNGALFTSVSKKAADINACVGFGQWPKLSNHRYKNFNKNSIFFSFPTETFSTATTNCTVKSDTLAMAIRHSNAANNGK